MIDIHGYRNNTSNIIVILWPIWTTLGKGVWVKLVKATLLTPGVGLGGSRKNCEVLLAPDDKYPNLTSTAAVL